MMHKRCKRIYKESQGGSVKNEFFTRKFVPEQGAKAPVKFADTGKAKVCCYADSISGVPTESSECWM